MLKSTLIAVIAAAAIGAPALAQEIQSSVDAASVGKRESTKLGLYLTSPDAGAALEADPSIVFIDVRTEAEFHYVGHPSPADMNIPWRKLAAGPVYDEKGAYKLQDNADFGEAVASLMAREGKDKDAPVFLICRSGGRSAAAVNYLAEQGYTKVYNVIDGFEGGKDKATGHRTVEGWRHADLPWTYKVEPAQAYRGPDF